MLAKIKNLVSNDSILVKNFLRKPRYMFIMMMFFCTLITLLKMSNTWAAVESMGEASGSSPVLHVPGIG